MTELHPKRCETCKIHKKVCDNLPFYYGITSGFPSSGCELYDLMDKDPDSADAYWKAIEMVGCASYDKGTEIHTGVTICYRCGDCCSWVGESKTYPRLLDFNGHPSCPADSPMPKEFRDDGP